MSEFLEDYGEFIALSLVIIPAVRMFYAIGQLVGQMTFYGG